MVFFRGVWLRGEAIQEARLDACEKAEEWIPLVRFAWAENFLVGIVNAIDMSKLGALSFGLVRRPYCAAVISSYTLSH